MATRIVLVEDERIVARVTQRMLEKAHYAVCGVFSTAEELLDDFENLNPGLVLMDIKLEGELDGVTASGIIRSRYNIPVILLTAHADDETIARAKTTGPFGYIIKPIDERELKSTIEMALYRSHLDRRLKKSEEQYRSFFEEDLSGDFVADSAGNIQACNPAMAEILEFNAPEELLDTNVLDLIPSGYFRDNFFTELKRLKKLRQVRTEMVSNAGNTLNVLCNVIGSFDKNGNLESFKGYLLDTTDMTRLEMQLLQSQKMEAIGRLAGGVAHDFNNILTVIMGYCTMISEKEADEPIDSDLDGIQAAAQKAAALTRQLLAFSRRQVLNPKAANLSSLVKDMEKMLRRLVPEDIQIKLYLEAEYSHIYIDPGQMEQILMNLVVNARDAMNDGGHITIRVKNLETTEILPTFTGEMPAGQYITLSVQDTGCGIEADILDNIFEPFFTTKGVNKGTGLGLSTVYGIVRQSNGFIDVHSEIESGTEFLIYLPRIAEKQTDDGETAQDQLSNTGQGTILVVEDEEKVRSLITRILSKRGYTVIEAANAGEAILIIEVERNDIDLLITDIIMPHMYGDRLAERLIHLKPDLKVLLMSGYPDQAIENRGIEDPQRHFIQKPFRPDDLTRRVRKILDD